MNISKYLSIVLLGVMAIFQQCHSPEPQLGFNPSMRPSIDSLLNTFSEDIKPEANTSVFVILKHIDANTLKIYLVAKKPLRSDFEVIGLPLTTTARNGINYYFFTGMEKLLLQDTLFWKAHPEIFDDRQKQAGGIYETPVTKKALYLFEDGHIEKLLPFDDMIFLGNAIDTLWAH